MLTHGVIELQYTPTVFPLPFNDYLSLIYPTGRLILSLLAIAEHAADIFPSGNLLAYVGEKIQK
jgi:hypothetical protein